MRHVKPHSMITLDKKFPFNLRDLRSFKSAFRECKSLSGAGKDGGFSLFMKGLHSLMVTVGDLSFLWSVLLIVHHCLSP